MNERPMRKRTVFDLCDTHDGRLGRGREIAVIVCEGGPAYGKPCSPRPCRVLPGSDYFAVGVTDDDVCDLVRNWDINRAG